LQRRERGRGRGLPAGEARLRRDHRHGFPRARDTRRTLESCTDTRRRPGGRCLGPRRGRPPDRKPLMTALLYVLGVVAFVLAILASIGLHELGHMVPAKAFGGKVTQYFIGFGPTVWSRRRGETEYGLKAIPLGGYVKIVGMLPPDAEDADKVEHDTEGNRVVTVRKSNTGMFGQLVSDARAAEWETITAADEPRLFYRMAWWEEVIVMARGATAARMIAFVIFAGLFATVGNPNDETVPPTADTVSACVI